MATRRNITTKKLSISITSETNELAQRWQKVRGISMSAAIDELIVIAFRGRGGLSVSWATVDLAFKEAGDIKEEDDGT